ncbi:MAG: exodeoxyribonuclease III [Selenomonadaceae bacterium]|nr:exodeoxyribonuclease III [Selenomonadaceae bacterium]
MKFVTWNVNGLRACLKKDFMDSFRKLDADIFAIQETKMQPEQAIIDLPNYRQFWNSAERKGYSGTAIFSKIEPTNVEYGIGSPDFDREGRSITLEFEKFFFINIYSPNSRVKVGNESSRLEYRCRWENLLREYLLELDSRKPIVLCGDLNVAHQPIDLKNPSANHHNSGFTKEEREEFAKLLNAGFIDAFRQKYPDKIGAYTWWSYLRHARESNAGWRIDYFITSKSIQNLIQDVKIHDEILGSDHCPVEIEIEI